MDLSGSNALNRKQTPLLLARDNPITISQQSQIVAHRNNLQDRTQYSNRCEYTTY